MQVLPRPRPIRREALSAPGQKEAVHRGRAGEVRHDRVHRPSISLDEGAGPERAVSSTLAPSCTSITSKRSSNPACGGTIARTPKSPRNTSVSVSSISTIPSIANLVSTIANIGTNGTGRATVPNLVSTIANVGTNIARTATGLDLGNIVASKFNIFSIVDISNVADVFSIIDVSGPCRAVYHTKNLRVANDNTAIHLFPSQRYSELKLAYLWGSLMRFDGGAIIHNNTGLSKLQPTPALVVAGIGVGTHGLLIGPPFRLVSFVRVTVGCPSASELNKNRKN